MFRTLICPSSGACDYKVTLIAKTSVFTEQATDVVNRHYSRKLLKMDILMSETC